MSDELVDELLAGAKTPQELTGPGGLLSQLTKRLVERAMSAELDEHLGYPRGSAPRPEAGGKSRNGSTRRRCTPIMARFSWRAPVTVMGRLSRGSSRRASGV